MSEIMKIIDGRERGKKTNKKTLSGGTSYSESVRAK